MNVIWIISDTLRRNNLGCYGNGWMRTPVIDKLAEKSVRFDRYYLSTFPTAPARADHFTGRWSGAFMSGAFPKEQVTLAQILNRGGFNTACVSDNPFYIRREYNYDRGFRTFTELPGQSEFFYTEKDDVRYAWRHESDRYAPRVFTKATKWLEQHYKEDFFLYIDVWDPHEPWDAPDYYTELYKPDYDGKPVYPLYCRWPDVPGFTEEMLKTAYANYCGEISMVDTWMGRFLRQVENMGLMEKTAIIFTSDHGFYFGEHGGYFGKFFRAEPGMIPYWVYKNGGGKWTRSPMFEEISCIPLLICMPGIKPGTYSGLTCAIDLMPTVLQIMEQPVPDWVEGRSLIPALHNRSIKGREFIISGGTFYEQELRNRDMNVTTKEWTLLYYPLPEQSWLYNLKNDPKQEQNVSHKFPEVAGELHQYLLKFMRDTDVPEQYQEPRRQLKL